MSVSLESLKNYFWDADAGTLDPTLHKRFIIERILEHGDEKALQWLFGAFSLSDVVAVAEHSRRLSPKSRNYWRIKLNLWKTEAQSRDKREKIWKF